MVSDSQKDCNRRWDKENMRNLSCRVRTNIAEDFKIACELNNTTVGALLRQFVKQYVNDNYEAVEERKHELWEEYRARK